MCKFQCYSLKSSHPLLLPLSPKVCSLRLYLLCCKYNLKKKTTANKQMACWSPKETCLLTEDSGLLPMPFPVMPLLRVHLGTHPSFHSPRLTSPSPQAPTLCQGSPYYSVLSPLLASLPPPCHYRGGTMRASSISLMPNRSTQQMFC